jgi:gamma-glutamyl:cysteine ligase YbdK (ATP-grasp superfamily)
MAEDLKNLGSEATSMTVPSMGDVRGETKAFLQKADHVAVALFNIAKLSMAMKSAPVGLHPCKHWQARNTATMMGSPNF